MIYNPGWLHLYLVDLLQTGAPVFALLFATLPDAARGTIPAGVGTSNATEFFT